MPEEFDPYSQWLGILAHERPIDHYRLLGIARFTDDPQVVAVAADQRMALIRSYQTGPRGRFTQRLLNEIATAKLCLTNPAAKSAYDAMLEGLASATAPPPIARPPSTPAPSSTPPPRATVQPTVPALAIDAAIDAAIECGDTAEDTDGDWNDEASDGVTAGTITLGVALAVILLVASYVTWQVIAARGRSRDVAEGVINDVRLTDEGGPSRQIADAGDVPLPAEPIVVYQETDGSVNFTPSVATLHGGSLHMTTVDIIDTLAGWTTVDDVAIWKCKVVKLPPNGVFRVFVTYRATVEANEGGFQIAMDGRQKACQIRGVGEFVTDEYFLAVTRSGEQAMEVRVTHLPGGTFELKGIRLVMSNDDRP